MVVAVFGATGFVGRAVVSALRGLEVRPIGAPRLRSDARSLTAALSASSVDTHLLEQLTSELQGVDVVINAAGDPDASSLDGDRLYGANAVVPGVLLRAARAAGVERFVHVSSAVVQNDKAVLDSSECMRPFSAYSGSKVLGEEVVRELADGGIEVVRYRPPSVHAPGRRVTQRIARIARTPLGSVASPGDQPSPQALLPNVADAVAFLAVSPLTPPTVVHHPSEDVTVTSLMEDLGGGRRPTRIPRPLARLVVLAARLLGRLHHPTAANARRVEILWLGQAQDRSWLQEAGWQPVVSRDGWRELVKEEA